MMRKLITSLLSIFLLLGLLIPGSIFAEVNELVEDPVFMGNPYSVTYQLTDVADSAINKDNQALAIGGGYLGVTITANLGRENANIKVSYLIDHPGASTLKPDRNTIQTDGNGTVIIHSLAPNFDYSRNDQNTSHSWTLHIYGSESELIVPGSSCSFSIVTDGQFSAGTGTAYVGSPANIDLKYNGSRYVKYDPAEFTLRVDTETAGFSTNESVSVNYQVSAIALDAQGNNNNIKTGNNLSCSLRGNSSNQNNLKVTVSQPGTYQVNLSIIDQDSSYQYSKTSERITLSVGQDDTNHQYVVKSISYWGNYNDRAYFRITKKTQQAPVQPSDPGVDDGPSIVEPTPPVDTTVHVNSVRVSPSTVTLNVGNSTTLTANVSPSNATDKSVSWTTGNRNIATVDSNGRVTAVAGGDTYITAKTADGSKTDSCHVTVNSPVVHKDPESITLSANKVELEIGGSYNLVAEVHPADCQNKNVSWSSNNSGIATVSDGNIMAKGSGTTTITARTSNGKSQTCTVIVKEPVQQVKNVSNVVLKETKEVLTVGDSVVLHPTITPADATNKNVTWKSSDETIAIIEEGKVVAEKPGTVDIIVTTIDGNKTARCTITVAQPQPTDKDIKVTGISLEQTSATLKNGQSLTLNETIAPKDASNKNVTWYSTNDNVAQVNEHGIVKAINAGTAEIVVTTEDGNKTAKCILTVEKDEEVVVEPTEEFKPEEEPTTPEPEPAPSEPTTPEDPTPSEPSTPENPQPTPSIPTTKAVAVSYETHIENIGWGNIGYNGQDSGTTGRALRLEGIKINVSGDENLGIAYRTHVQDIGWMNYVSNGTMSGTEGQAKRLEAIQIQLTGTDKDKYDVYYRVHAQDVGWMNWAKNGDSAGTAGFARRLEAIEIKVVPKGEVPAIPASTPNATNQAFLQK